MNNVGDVGEVKSVYLQASGGLGDIIQVYLASPDSRDDEYSEDHFASCDPIMSMWFRRLENFKAMHPDCIVKVIVESHNPHSAELFNYHPVIDKIIVWPLSERTPEERLTVWSSDHDGATIICDVFSYDDYDVAQPVVYMSPEESRLVQRVVDGGKYIVLHPFAGHQARRVLSLRVWERVADMFVDMGYNVVVLGASYRQTVANTHPFEFFEMFKYKRRGILSLVNRVSARVSVNVVFGAVGFVGTHSCMVLPAWYKSIRSVCVVPQVRENGESWSTFFASKNPTTWGASKPFNKTVIADSPRDVNLDEIVGWVNNFELSAETTAAGM